LSLKNQSVWIRRVWRYQRGNRKQKIEGQTTQWPEEKAHKDKQRSTKKYTENERSSNRNTTKNQGDFMCSGRV